MEENGGQGELEMTKDNDCIGQHAKGVESELIQWDFKE